MALDNSDTKFKEHLRSALELVEEARLFYTNQHAGITFQVITPLLGLVLLVALWFMVQDGLPQMSSYVSGIFSSLGGGGGGGYGHGHHHQRWTSASGDGNVMYDDYDYGSYGYSGAAAEHYEAKEEVSEIIKSASNQRPVVKPGSAFYSGDFVKPGGHLVQRQLALAAKQ